MKIRYFADTDTALIDLCFEDEDIMCVSCRSEIIQGKLLAIACVAYSLAKVNLVRSRTVDGNARIASDLPSR